MDDHRTLNSESTGTPQLDWETRARRAEATLREIVAHLDANDRFTAEKFTLREILARGRGPYPKP